MIKTIYLDPEILSKHVDAASGTVFEEELLECAATCSDRGLTWCTSRSEFEATVELLGDLVLWSKAYVCLDGEMYVISHRRAAA